MSTVRNYWERMPTEELRQVLRDHCNGCSDISADTVLTVCSILAQRSPDKPDAAAAFRRFCQYYLYDNENDL